MDISYNLARPSNQPDRSSAASFFDIAYAMHIEGIWHSLSYLPNGGYRQFCEWLLGQTSLRDRWLQLTSVTKTIVLTEKLLADLLTEDELESLLPYSVTLNTYLMYEVVSDNLAIGLARQMQGDSTYDGRREVLQAFNTASSQAFRHPNHPKIGHTLEPFHPMFEKISAFHQSLNASQHERLVAAYLANNGHHVRRADLEYSVYPNLIANFEAGMALKEVIQEFDSFEMLREGLAQRYEGINHLLQGVPLSLEALVEIGTDTILVVPTVGYYAALIGEYLRPTPQYAAVLEDGTLSSALRDSALLVRLLNDMGTAVLEQTPDERDVFISTLRQMQNTHHYDHFGDLLAAATNQSDLPLTRLKKDLQFGEFNLALYGVYRAPSVSDSIVVFGEHLAALSALYHERRQRLQGTVRQLSMRLGGPAIGTIIFRFAEFHRHLYRNSSETSDGEYAI